MPRPIKATAEDVLALIHDLGSKVPPEMTLAHMLGDFIEQIARLSGRIQPKEVSDLITVATVMAKYAAAAEFGMIPIKVPQETRQ